MPSRARGDSFWSGRRCLVVGGAGSLGRHIVALLVERGAAVSSFDIAEFAGSSAVTSHVGSVLDRAALDAACEDVSVVFHTASVIDIRPIPSLRMQQVNVEGTYQVVMACKV